jgi:outer membrane scaffolding protein for murein synthesis (MipA/OmpV family)
LLRAALALAAAWAVGPGAAFAQTAAQPAPGAPLAQRGGLLTATNPDLVTTLRAGVAVSPAYLGSDDYELGPDLDIRFDYIRLPGGLEFGSSSSVGFRTGWGLSGSLRYLGDRDSNDHDEIRGLDNVPWSLEAGLGVGYEQRNYRAFTDVRYGFVGHNAWVGEIGADAIAYPMDGLTVTLGPRLEFGDDKFAQTYFGVSPSEEQASGLDQFDAHGGLLAAGLELGGRYRFNERWGVEGAASWGRLLNDAADSPITETGSEDQYRIRLGITRSISLDF